MYDPAIDQKYQKSVFGQSYQGKTDPEAYMLRLMTEYIHSKEAADAPTQYHIQKKPLFGDSPFPFYGFAFVDTHGREGDNIDQN